MPSLLQPHQKCSANFSTNSLICLVTGVDSAQVGLISARGLDDPNQLDTARQIAVFAHAIFGHEGAPSRSRDLILPDRRIDQRERPASAPIRSLIAASNWLAGAANINRVSSW